jgi:glycosyltransferase involved in cell wall biosynthesis
MNKPALISFIIPAFNEEKHIPLCLSSIKRFFSKNVEVIVIDNGSTDQTVKISHQFHADVIIDEEASIARMRNLGAEKAQGKILIFLDADIELTEQWYNQFNTLQDHILNKKVLIGSQAAVPNNPSTIEEFWFEEFYKKEKVTHLGSAHLITSKKTFDLIEGFDESLETGEDYDFCQRAKLRAVKIENIIQLKVIHYGFPKTIRSFIKRECWHGKGDLINFKAFLQSKVALATSLFLFFHMFLITSLVFQSLPFILLSIVLLCSLLVASTLKKYSHSSWKARLINFFIFYFYFIGRAGSFVHVAQDKFNKK